MGYSIQVGRLVEFKSSALPVQTSGMQSAARAPANIKDGELYNNS